MRELRTVAAVAVVAYLLRDRGRPTMLAAAALTALLTYRTVDVRVDGPPDSEPVITVEPNSSKGRIFIPR